MLAEFHFVRDPAAYPYLRAQKGRISHLSGDAFWTAYDKLVFRDYLDLVMHLPLSCHAVLDVGGGMGGIDAIIARHYAPAMPKVVVLDGDGVPPVMKLHRVPFADRAVCERFLYANGVQQVGYVTPENARKHADPVVFPEADLVLSLGAWCFHFAPDEYLKYVLAVMAPAATLILDVRCDKPDWLFCLMQSLTEGPIIRRSDNGKFERRVFFNGRADRLLQNGNRTQAAQGTAA